MLKNHKRNILYCLASLLSLCCLLWLILALKNTGDVPVNQFQGQGGTKLAVASSIETPPKEPVEPVTEVASTVDTNDSEPCISRCRSTLSILDGDLTIDDETLPGLRSSAKQIAAYLQSDESQRQSYLEMALTTTDDNKRSLITDIFLHLPYQQKAELGASFIGSENWRIRVDGVALITDHDTPNAEVVTALLDLFANEQNAYVKGQVLNYLKHSPTLKGDVGMLQQLDAAIHNESSSYVRVSALKAKMKLSEQPYHILPDALQAINSRDPVFQLAGLNAINQVLKQKETYVESGVYIDMSTIKNNIEGIINSTAYKNDDSKDIDRLVKKADGIYLRHFDN